MVIAGAPGRERQDITAGTRLIWGVKLKGMTAELQPEFAALFASLLVLRNTAAQ
jgi:hypothetical protein